MRQLEALMWKQVENDIRVESDKENKSFQEKVIKTKPTHIILFNVAVVISVLLLKQTINFV
jgi:hypothetical protein